MSDKIRVLLVEDEQETAKWMVFNLRQQGLNCVSAGSLSEAIKIISEGSIPESALIDLTFPQDNCNETFKPKETDTSNSRTLIEKLKELTGGRCRIISTTVDPSVAERFNTWGFYRKDIHDDFSLLGHILGQGYLKNDELDQPAINIRGEIYKDRLER